MAIFEPQKIRRERTSDAVLHTLRDSIVTGVFLPGERLNTAEVARKLGLSTAPVRDALNRLEAEGLIEIRPRSGTFVSELSPVDVRETFEIRAALECLALELGAASLNGDHIAEFHDLLRKMNDPDTSESLHEQLNREFHGLIVEMSGNRRLIQMYRRVGAHITIARIHHRRSGWKNRVTDEQKEHHEIVRAIEESDIVRARAALKAHILAAADRLSSDLAHGATKAGEAKAPVP